MLQQISGTTQDYLEGAALKLPRSPSGAWGRGGGGIVGDLKCREDLQHVSLAVSAPSGLFGLKAGFWGSKISFFGKHCPPACPSIWVFD